MVIFQVSTTFHLCYCKGFKSPLPASLPCCLVSSQHRNCSDAFEIHVRISVPWLCWQCSGFKSPTCLLKSSRKTRIAKDNVDNSSRMWREAVTKQTVTAAGHAHERQLCNKGARHERQVTPLTSPTNTRKEGLTLRGSGKEKYEDN